MIYTIVGDVLAVNGNEMRIRVSEFDYDEYGMPPAGEAVAIEWEVVFNASSQQEAVEVDVRDQAEVRQTVEPGQEGAIPQPATAETPEEVDEGPHYCLCDNRMFLERNPETQKPVWYCPVCDIEWSESEVPR